MQNCENNTVYGNEIKDNGNSGIYLSSSDRNDILNNDIMNEGTSDQDSGIRISGSDSNTVSKDELLKTIKEGMNGNYITAINLYVKVLPHTEKVTSFRKNLLSKLLYDLEN